MLQSAVLTEQHQIYGLTRIIYKELCDEHYKL